jgi:CDGSH-type Zn-finger protein
MNDPLRRQHAAAPATSARIATIDDLREHPRWIELEYATLPPYLCALYSHDPERNPEAVEAAISVLEEEDGLAGALWVTGGVPVQRADGPPLETRNRMTLCRRGRSAGKPLCDGTHRKIDFREEAPGPATAPAGHGITTENGRTA